MKKLSYSEIKALKPGDIFLEEAYGQISQWQTIEAPAEELNGDAAALVWSAIDVATGMITQPYLITKGFEHYGPKIYIA